MACIDVSIYTPWKDGSDLITVPIFVAVTPSGYTTIQKAYLPALLSRSSLSEQNTTTMSPPWVSGDRPRGPPPFVVQMLRAPLTLNNIIALAITYQLPALPSPHSSVDIQMIGHQPLKMCHNLFNRNSAFSVLTFLFLASTIHNFLTIGRFHRIRREVFGESMCAARRRWRREGGRVMDEEERRACQAKFGQMMKRMPSLFISGADILLALSFLGVYIWSTLLVKSIDNVTLGMGYATIGALVAS